MIECNLRASRSFPFVSKVLKINFIDLATRVMLGLPVEKPAKSAFDLDYVGVKASQFSFSRLGGADPVLGVDMASTGEVGCLGDDTDAAILTALLAVGLRVPRKAVLLSTGSPKQKADMLDAAHLLHKAGLRYTPRAEHASSSTRTAFRQFVCTGLPRPTAPAGARHAAQPRDRLCGKHTPISPAPSCRTAARYAARLSTSTYPCSRTRGLPRPSSYAFTAMPLEDIEIKSWQEY